MNLVGIAPESCLAESARGDFRIILGLEMLQGRMEHIVWLARNRLPVEQGFDPCYGKDGDMASKTRMAKVTSKYQVTVPKKIADAYNIRPGDDIDWVPAGEVIRVIPPSQRAAPEGRESQLRLFDQATERHRKRPSAQTTERPRDRGWRREDLYRRGRSS